MRVALFFFRLHLSSGGAERMIVWLANSLAERGHEVHLVSWDAHDAELFYPLHEVVFWHKLGFVGGYRDKFRRTVELTLLLKRLCCDVFVGFVMSTDKTVYAACRITHIPIVVAERNSPEMYRLKFNRLTRLFYMALFFLAKRVVVQFEEYRTGYPRLLNSRISVIGNPIAHPKVVAMPAKKHTDSWTLLCVARLEQQKNIQVLVEAYSLLHKEFPDWNLRVVGEGSLRSSLEKEAVSRGLSQYVQFVGATRDVHREYVAAHLFCLPSLWEGFPNALAEALAHGLPSVGFAGCPGVASLISDGVNGFLAPENGDASALAFVLRRLMRDSDLRVKAGEEAAKITQKFKASSVVDQWERILTEFVND